MDWRAFAEQVERGIRSHRAGVPIDLPVYDAYTAGMFMRCVTAFRAVRVLADAGLDVEAGMISRTLFTDSVQLQELEAAGNRRAELVVGWALKSLREFQFVADDAARAGVDLDPATTREQIESMRQGFLGLAEREGIEPRQFEDEKSLARRHRRLQDYVDYRYASHLVHVSIAALHQRHSRRDDVVAIGDLGPKPEYVEAMVHFAAKSVLLARQATGHMFGWPESQQVADLLRFIEEERPPELRESGR